MLPVRQAPGGVLLTQTLIPLCPCLSHTFPHSHAFGAAPQQRRRPFERPHRSKGVTHVAWHGQRLPCGGLDAHPGHKGVGKEVWGAVWGECAGEEVWVDKAHAFPVTAARGLLTWHGTDSVCPVVASMPILATRVWGGSEGGRCGEEVWVDTEVWGRRRGFGGSKCPNACVG